MKRILLGLLCALFLCGLGPLPVVSAHAWPWHRHHNASSDPVNARSSHKTKKAKVHREKHSRDNSDALYTTPKSVGWWHHRGPGPAGAGVK